MPVLHHGTHVKAGDVIAERFVVEALIGEGGMGTVFRALDRQSGAPVALKVLGTRELSHARLSREGRALAELDHPSIVRYVSHGTTPDGQVFVVMEWLEGQLLGNRLKSGALAHDETLDLARRLCSALAHAHARGVIHRDLAPNNVLLTKGRLDMPKILDFGLALVGADSLATSTQGAPVGTPGYMAPEQAQGDVVDARADLFSLGCVLFECVTARPAFWAEHYLAVLAKIALADAPDVRTLRPDAPPGLALLIRALLSKDVDDRPANAALVLEHLVEFGGSSPSLLSTTQNAPAIGQSERKVVSVVVAGTPTHALDRTLALAELDERAVRIDAVARDHGAYSARLGKGAFAVPLTGAGAATDQATRAVRCALAVRESEPTLPIAVATGWAVVSGELPLGDAIDRAVALLGSVSGDGITTDESTARLLPARFEVREANGAHLVLGERRAEGGRSLLGRTIPCVGRDRELKTLRALVDEAFHTPLAQAVLLTGPAGVGKSRLRVELLRDTSKRIPDTQVWLGRCDALRAGSPFAALADALRRGLSLDEAPNATPMQTLTARVRQTVAGEDAPRVRDFLAELLSLDHGQDPSPQLLAARNDAVLMGDQIRRACEDFVRRSTEQSPLVIVLEDFHWGDHATVRLVDGLLRNLPEQPLFLLALGRPEVLEKFPSLWMDRGAQQVRVTPLTRRASESLVREALGAELPQGELDELVQRAQGNAFFLEELVRAHAAGGHRELPESVLAMVQGRLEAMEPEARRVLRAASVFGRLSWLGGIAALLGGDSARDEIEAWIHTLVEREVLLSTGGSRFPGEPEFAFRHALVRDAAYTMLTPDDRKLGHRLAAQWLEAAGDTDAVAIAQHLQFGMQPALALPWWRKAAASALDAGDFDATTRYAETGIAAATRDEDRGAFEALAAEALRLKGDLVAADAAGTRALGLLPVGSTAWCAAAGERSLLLQRLGRRTDVERLGSQLLDATALQGADDALTMARLRAAIAVTRSGDENLAARLAQAAESAVAPSGPVTRAWGHALRALSALKAGRRGDYLEAANACRACHLQVGDTRSALEQSINLGSAYVELGAFERAEEMLRSALEEAERLGLSHAAAGARHNLGLALGRLGRIQEAIDEERRALAVFQAEDRRLEGGTRASLALIAMWGGAWDVARLEAQRGLEHLREVAPPLVPVALTVLARAALADGDVDDALQKIQQARAAVDEHGGVEFVEGLLRLTVVEALLAADRDADARIAACDAANRLRTEAVQLGDPLLQKAYLERIPENVRIFQLEAELSQSS